MNTKNEILSLKNKDCEIIFNADLKKFSTFHIGGKAKYLFITKTTNTLLDVCSFCKTHNIMYKVIGFGSNLLFSDKGYNGAIIVNRSHSYYIRKDCVYVDSGLSINSFLSILSKHELAGLENLASIPSTIGGAVVNNTGAFDCSFSNFVEYVECVKISNLNKRLKLKYDECNFSYRNSLFKSGEYIILRVKLKLFKSTKTEILSKMHYYSYLKANSQPINNYSAGSVFKRSLFSPAKLIDEMGLKGTKIGGAMISNKHAGFIINYDNATASDVKVLIKFIKNEFKKNNLKIEEEIEFVGYSKNSK